MNFAFFFSYFKRFVASGLFNLLIGLYCGIVAVQYSNAGILLLSFANFWFAAFNYRKGNRFNGN